MNGLTEINKLNKKKEVLTWTTQKKNSENLLP